MEFPGLSEVFVVPLCFYYSDVSSFCGERVKMSWFGQTNDVCGNRKIAEVLHEDCMKLRTRFSKNLVAENVECFPDINACVSV